MNLISTGPTVIPYPPRHLIIAKTTGEVRTFLAELANGTTNYRTVNSLTQQIEHQYHSRFVIELLQNAHDAVKAAAHRGLGRIEFHLLTEEAEHGVLYVANDGQPFRYQDFLAIARLGQSAKDPRESIGHKGLGFRSVLEIASAPEVYSQNSDDNRPAEDLFAGFNFRFAPGVLGSLQEFLHVENLARAAHPLALAGVPIDLQEFDRTAILNRVRQEGFDASDEVRYLSPYLLPLPINDVPEGVRTFGERGFSSVIRLPLASAELTSTVADRLLELDSEAVLFLDSLRTLRIHVSSRSDRVLSRSATPEPNSLAVRVRIQERADIQIREFLTWRKTFGDNNAEDRNRILAAVKSLPESWHQLDRADLCAAVSCAEPANGRFFIYLPTDVLTATAAHLNAPFYGDLSRTGIDFTLPINALFLDALREWLLDEIAPSLIGGSTQEAVALVDLLAPTGSMPPRIIEGQTTRLSKMPLLLTQHGWAHAEDARPIPDLRSRYLDSSRLRARATFKALDSSLDTRLASASKLITMLGGTDRPRDSEIAATIERVALGEAEQIDWIEFWTDVEHLLPRNAAALRGRRVLLVQDGSLVASDPEQNQLRVFFPPLRADGEGSDDPPAPADVPQTLQSRIAFLSDRIPLRRALPNGRQERTPVRSYLQDQLVDDYGAEPILRRVVLPSLPKGEVALDSPEAVRCAEALDFAFRIVASARERTTLLPLLRDLRFPCRGGWLSAHDTTFGPGWPGRDGDRLCELLSEVDTDLSRAELAQLLLPPDDRAWAGHGPTLLGWASQVDLGIATGLRVLEDPGWVGRCWLQRGFTPQLPSTPPSGIPAELWAQYADEVRSQINPAFVGTYRYDLEAPPFVVGLDRVAMLSNRGLQNLTLVLLRSIGDWKSDWRRTSLTKADGQSHSLSIESFLSWAVGRLPWLWSLEGAPSTSIRDRWFVAAVAEPGQSHQYDHLKPVSPEIVRAVQRMVPSPLPVLAELGLRVLDSETPTSNSQLLQDLANALDEGSVNPTNASVFIGQVRSGWGVFAPAGASSMPDRLVVTRAGRQPESLTPTAETPIYLPDVRQRWFDSGPLAKFPVLVIRPADANRLLPSFEARFGTSIRRLSGIRIDAWSGDQLWAPSPEIAALEQTSLSWLVPFTLCVAVARDPRQHRQTKAFREALATLRAARVDRVAGLNLRLRGEVDSAPAEVSAFWHDEERILLYDETDQKWLVGLAGPLASILDRMDVQKDLRLALTELKGNAAPDDEQQRDALVALDIDVDEFNEVRQACSGDLSWIVDRILPALTLADSAFDSADLAVCTSIDEIRTVMDSVLGGDPPSAWLIDAARGSNGDGQMGRALWERVGHKAELQAWNAALQRLQPPRRRVENPRWLEEFRTSRTPLLTPLRALLRHLCVQSGTGANYRTVAEGLLTDPPADGLRYSCWQVGCREVLQVTRPIIDALAPSEPIRRALDGAQNSIQLSHLLRSECPEIDPERDPSEDLRENLLLIARVFDAVRATAVAYHAAAQGGGIGPWGEDLTSLRTVLEGQLSQTDGYFLKLDEETAIRYLLALLNASLSGQSLLQGTFGAALHASSTIDALRRCLGVNSDALARVDGVLSSHREAERRRRRLVNVCGTQLDPEDSELASHAWRTIGTLPDAAIQEIDPNQPLALKTLAKRPRTTRNGGSSSQSSSSRRRIPEREAHLVGLLGEMFAFRVLQKRFGADSVGAGSWRSENSRAIFPGNPADDGLGYDFVVIDGRKTWYIEVKASLDDSEEFALGSSEVRTALERAESRKERYRILHVRNVRSVPQAHFLPNPFDRASKGRFDLDEAGLRVRYRL